MSFRLRRACRAALRFLSSGFCAMTPVWDSPAALIDCPACGKSFSCPIESEPVDDEHWWIRLRCGACESWRDVVVPDADANALDRALGRQTATIERAVQKLDQERMALQLDAFVTALEHDLIDPSSFAI
jgi:hypothetical protein